MKVRPDTLARQGLELVPAQPERVLDQPAHFEVPALGIERGHPPLVQHGPFQGQRLAGRQAAVLASEESRAVRFSIEDHCLCLTGRASDVGESKVSLDAEYEGTPVSCAFNADYVLDGLKVLDAERITFRFSGKDTPARIDGEEDFIFVVMPVTLRSG